MKSIINKTLLAMLALLPLLAACQSDPDVGTPLYPVEEEDFSPKLYVYSGSPEGNFMTSKVVLTPEGLYIPEDTLRFRVNLTRAVEQDITVTLSFDAEKATAYDETAETVPNDALSLVVGSVTIPAGKMTSTEEFVVALNHESPAMQSLVKHGVLALVLTTTSSNAISKDFSTYYWDIYKEELNVYEQSLGTNMESLGDLVEIDKSNYTITYTSASWSGEFTDGTVSSFNYGSLRSGGTITYEFTEPRTVKAFGFVPPAYSSYLAYSLGEVKVETSNDGDNWTDHGTLTCSKPSVAYEWNSVKFYAAPTTKFVRYTAITNANGATTIYLSEIKIFE